MFIHTHTPAISIISFYEENVIFFKGNFFNSKKVIYLLLTSPPPFVLFSMLPLWQKPLLLAVPFCLWQQAKYARRISVTEGSTMSAQKKV